MRAGSRIPLGTVGTVGSLVSLVGCFGAGPVPGNPPQATVLMQLAPPPSNECSQTQYIGPVGLGPVYGYAGVLVYQPQVGCNNGQTTPPSTEVTVWQWAKDGSGTATIAGGPAGMSDGTFSPRLQGIGAGVIWLSSPGPQGPGGHVDVGGTVAGFTLQIPTASSFYAPQAILRDADYVYIAAQGAGTGGKAEPNNPNYPCCGPVNQGADALLDRIDPEAPTLVAEPMPITPKLDCGHSTRCLVQSADSLIYLAFAPLTGSGWYIGKYPKAGTSPSEEQVLASPSMVNGTVPVGFHGTDANVVWAMSRQYDQAQGGTTPRCEINRYDLTNNIPVGPIYVNDSFDCAGISVDDESVYFTIVETSDQQHMRGLGIGRVHLDTRQVETINLGIFGATAGPRRVLIDDDDLIVVDPFTVARIPKTALDGQHDFDE